MKKQTDSIAIQLTNISKAYTIHHEKPTFVQRFINGRDKSFRALKDINLTIKKGERVGIIGPNGSGKTTLLKIIAGITTATSGQVETYGRIVSLIELEAGFHPDLTGIENIYLNGMILGRRKKDVTLKMQSIIAFADIGRFIHAPLFTYSQGMKLRLGFSLAIHAEPDVLILDEGFSVGDENFQKKSQKKIYELYSQRKTFILVSHWLPQIRQNCNRVIIMDKGEITHDGSKKILLHYGEQF